jgi:uncharacterized damage-inducible protein DinB
LKGGGDAFHLPPSIGRQGRNARREPILFFSHEETHVKVQHLSCVFLLTVLLFVAGVFGQAPSKGEKTAPTKGFRAEFLWQLKDAEDKVLSLADAFPAKTYGWRPMDGVRSTSEVFVHIAASNYMLPSLVGVKSPVNNARDLEKTLTDKQKVVEFLKQSFAHLRQAILNTSEKDLEKPAKFFQEGTTVRGVYFLTATHLHEHLGQLIAYARENRIVPPWSAAEESRGQKTQQK